MPGNAESYKHLVPPGPNLSATHYYFTSNSARDNVELKIFLEPNTLLYV